MQNAISKKRRAVVIQDTESTSSPVVLYACTRGICGLYGVSLGVGVWIHCVYICKG
jgi:hypothetical protein